MKKVVAVFGATGQQGGSVARFILQDEELSKRYAVRIIVRNTSKPAVSELTAMGAEVSEADLDNESRIREALRGVHSVFVLTNFFDHLSKLKEIEQSKRIADIAVSQGVELLIYSSLPSAFKLSGGVYKDVQHFDGKAESEEYMRGLPIKSAFYLPGCYMQNFLQDFRPYPVGDDTFAIMNVVNPSTEVPLLDIRDTGKYVGAILANPDKFNGRDIAAASCYTFEELAQLIREATGRNVIYRQLPDDKHKAMLPEAIGEEITGMFGFFRDFGLYGADQKAKVAADAKEAGLKPTTLDEFIKEHAKQFADLLSSKA